MTKLTYEEARINKGINNISEIATMMGISEKHYSEIESYNKQIKDDELMKFCELTKVAPNELLIKNYNC